MSFHSRTYLSHLFQLPHHIGNLYFWIHVRKVCVGEWERRREGGSGWEEGEGERGEEGEGRKGREVRGGRREGGRERERGERQGKGGGKGGGREEWEGYKHKRRMHIHILSGNIKQKKAVKAITFHPWNCSGMAFKDLLWNTTHTHAYSLNRDH